MINNVSGKKNGTDWKKEIETRFKDLPHKIRFFVMPKHGAKAALKKDISEFYPHKVVAVGGDGTVTFVANQLLGKKIEMGILPAGSANGMAKELNIPADPQKAIDVILEGTAKDTDVIRMNDEEICLHLSDVGINAQIVKYFEEGPVRGKIGYGLALMKALMKKSRIKVSIQAKDEEILRTAILVIIANASKYGTGATINPRGNIHDGLFEVVVVRKIGMAEIMKMFLKFQRFNPKNIEVIQARSATIETEKYAHFQVDGEYLGKVQKVSAKILPGQLKVLMPAETS